MKVLQLERVDEKAVLMKKYGDSLIFEVFHSTRAFLFLTDKGMV